MTEKTPIAEIQRRESLRKTLILELQKEFQIEAIREAIDRATDVPRHEIIDAINEHLEATR